MTYNQKVNLAVVLMSIKRYLVLTMFLPQFNFLEETFLRKLYLIGFSCIANLTILTHFEDSLLKESLLILLRFRYKFQ